MRTSPAMAPPMADSAVVSVKMPAPVKPAKEKWVPRPDTEAFAVLAYACEFSRTGSRPVTLAEVVGQAGIRKSSGYQYVHALRKAHLLGPDSLLVPTPAGRYHYVEAMKRLGYL